MTENEVVDAVAIHLETIGYSVKSKLNTSQRGIDIEAIHLATGKQLLIEAKGGTSSKPTSKRFGKDFDGGQALSHVSRAFFSGAKLLQKYKGEQACIALAFPNDRNHLALVDAISDSLELLQISVFFVGSVGPITIRGKLC
jgi:hypothetical protein